MIISIPKNREGGVITVCRLWRWVYVYSTWPPLVLKPAAAGQTTLACQNLGSKASPKPESTHKRTAVP